MKTNLIWNIKNVVLAGLLGIFSLGSPNIFAHGFGIYSHGHDHEQDGDGESGVNFADIHFAGLPSLNAPSLPAFGQSVMVKFKFGKLGSTLSATDHNGEHISSLISPNNHWSIKKTSYNLTANFDSSGAFTTGNVSIMGRIPGLGINSTQTLMTADLTAFAKGSSGKVYGFNTANIVCNPIVDAAVHCTLAEVVYFALDNAQKSMTKSWSTKAIALTSIPVPAAAWLFGTGLIGLVGCSRRTANRG